MDIRCTLGEIIPGRISIFHCALDLVMRGTLMAVYNLPMAQETVQIRFSSKWQKIREFFIDRRLLVLSNSEGYHLESRHAIILRLQLVRDVLIYSARDLTYFEGQ